MKRRRRLAIVLRAVAAGCAADGVTVRKGMRYSEVRGQCGAPDVISERAGDEERFFVPEDAPGIRRGYGWAADTLTYYYLERDLAVTFASGRVVRTARIDPRRRDGVLLPLVARDRRAG